MKIKLCVYTVLFVCTVGTGSLRAQTVVSETNWGGANSEVAEGMALMSDGSAVITGFTTSFIAQHGSIFVVRFTPDGTALAWQRTWEAPNQFVDDTAADVAVAADDSIYVVGRTLGVSGDALLLKFDSGGTLLWQRTFGRGPNNSENAEAVAVAPDGSVYVAGGTTDVNTGASRLLVLKFSSGGSLVWSKTLDGESGGASGIAVSPDGTLYAAATTLRPDVIHEFDVLVLKINQVDGSLVWQRTYSAGEIVDARGGVAVGADGAVYFAGGLQEPSHGITDLSVLVVRLTAGGSLEWDRFWGGRSGEEPKDVFAAADGSVYVAGQTNSFAVGSDDAFVVQFLPSAKVDLAVTWGGADLDGGAGVAVDANNTISLGATANVPPYSLLDAPMKSSRARGVLNTPAHLLVDAAGVVADPGGTVTTPNGVTGYAGGFDAALVRIIR